MRPVIQFAVFLALLLVFPNARSTAAEPEKTTAEPRKEINRKEDVIYARHYGVAFTMDVFTPNKNANGLGVVFCVSAGWFSEKEVIDMNLDLIRPLLSRGYTVFAVVHGSQPKYTIPEIVEQMHLAVQFIRAHAQDYGVDPQWLGVMGGSAGGHLAMLLATSGRPPRPDAKDPVSRESSRVAAVGCFFPPTDFANYGKEGESVIGRGDLPVFKAPFDFKEFDGTTGMFVPVTDEQKKRVTLRSISPVSYVTKESAPALIFHGDNDALVPLQQSELIVQRYRQAGAPCELVIKKGAGHGWKGMDKDVDQIADWFDKYLRK